LSLNKPRLQVPVLLAAWCGVLFLYGIASGSLYRTESLRAIIGRECLHGHWLFPVLYGEPFLTKPPGQYVAIGLSSLPSGEVTEATARLPSVIAASVAVFLFYGLFRRSLGERTALLAALLLPTSILWLDKVPSAEIDMTLVGWVTASVVLFHRALKPHEEPSVRLLVLSLLCVAGGTLTKWTAPAFFYLTVIPLLAWRGELRFLFGWRHLLAVGVAASVCLLWAIVVAHEVGWETLIDTVRKEAAYRFAPKPGAKVYPWSEVATYPLLVWMAHLPLSFFALLTFRPSFWKQWDDRGKLLLQLLHCWTWPNLLFWSLVPNHNVRYAIPMSPGLMGLGVMGLIGCGFQLSATRPERWRRRALYIFLTIWFVVKVTFVEVVIPLRTAHHNPEPTAATLRGLIPVDHSLYLFRLKDEGVMFYYGRSVFRLNHIEDLPPGEFAVLLRQEWDEWAALGTLKLVSWLQDQQGEPLILVRATKGTLPSQE
jgi:4-amino-4-deoxy-L-arabinose transferase-like glycosyltransferase